MIIVVEGSDGGGKSTLVKALSEKLGYSTYKESISYKDRQSDTYDGFIHYGQEMLKHKDESKDNLIIDRFFTGEFVCPHVYRYKDKRKPLTLSEIGTLALIMSKLSPIAFVTCVPSVEFAKNVFKERGEDVARAEDVDYLNNLYTSVAVYLKSLGFKSFIYSPNVYYGKIDVAVDDIMNEFDLWKNKNFGYLPSSFFGILLSQQIGNKPKEENNMKRTTTVRYETSDGKVFTDKDEALKHEIDVVLTGVIGKGAVERLTKDQELLGSVYDALRTLRQMTRPKKERKPRAEKNTEEQKEQKGKKAKAS